MSSMFFNCINLTFINLSNFVTSQVNDTSEMFYNCSSLKLLNLANFDTTNINNLNGMFYGCQNLEFLNFSISNQESSVNNIFLSTYLNLIFCNENSGDIIIDIYSSTKKYILCNNNKK